jgi:hypothetical protein
MRTAFVIAALGLAQIAAAQIPIPPFGSTFTATLTRGYWFQAPAAGIVTGISVPNETQQPFQAIEFLDLGATPPPAFPATVVGTQLHYSNNTAGGSLVPVTIPLVPGNYYGVLGACTNAIGSATAYNSYANAGGTFASNILGIPTTLTRFGTQFGIGAGGNNPCWSEVGSTISRVDLYIVPSGGGTIATNTTLGQGCIQQYASFYENFATACGFDLANTSLTMLPTGTGYFVLPGISAYIPPSPAATALTLGDDTQTAVTLTAPFAYPGGTTTSLSVCSNGYVSVSATGNGTGYTPVVTTFLNASNTGWWNWHDYNPSLAGSGQVKFEQVGSIACVTWDGVYSFGTTAPDTFQMQFDTSSGAVHICWGAMGAQGNGYLVGYSPGGASANPGNRDLSATLPLTFQLENSDILPLSLAATSRPVTNTNWNLSVNNVPATGVIGVDVFGLSDPGLNDLFFLGAPGCGLRAALDVTNGWIVNGATHTYSLSIPNNPALVSFSLYTTSAVFQVPTVNALGAITSNGINGVVGNL